MFERHHGSAAAVFLAAFVGATAAGAQTAPIERGLEFALSESYGGFTQSFARADDSLRTGPSAAFDAEASLRVSSAWSLGAHFRFQDLTCQDTNCERAGAQALSGGVAARVRPLRGRSRVDPWFGVGVEFGDATYGRVAYWNGGRTVGTLHVFALALPVSAGLDVAVTRSFSVGPTASFAAWIPLGGCYSVTEETPRGASSHGECSGPEVLEDWSVNVAWSVGLAARYTLPL